MRKWLERVETKLHRKILNVAVAFGGYVLWMMGVDKVYNYIYAEKNMFESQIFFPNYKHPALVTFYTACFLAPLIEEILFRKLPLDLVKASGKNQLLIPTMLFSSIVFAIGHYGGYSIPIQGVLGLLACILYIKNDSSYWSAWSLHFIWNLLIITNLLHL